ncbi:exsB protein [Desulforamulus reducens MI-1]|uniref:7-cyano-7-deazaguanine synthase n=1 Tax=Desulforamulus reducens (strain ATCC BAA-1160 / DSM 100696 / MI-1) TaxID=349161 RepID=QUEC_DESRM|nr:7-cyano-7-deazaguanine synthase QueC [Desulforamulus reducens]A4J5C7.1 RecName: Full=7-cyano-7-deazaguanine synthase; AltName: Full=7-cyano-7-carbaguanine synthase; AltName: Full=PreQ(0) synthase; AltName: Full=Queuosine biosynthesis protein QueC [Desulforamulus reducens MI-1]ABO50280.1 exsB protein [Desulforamulus reducens MI-1]
MNSVVLLSGGLDSAVNLAFARTEGNVKLALTINYRQRAAHKEIAAAAQLARYYAIPHRVIELPWLAEITKTALVRSESQLPEPKTEELDQLELAGKTAAEVWVPNRNGLFVNIAACFAETLHCEIVVAGFNCEEAATFPDNTPEFALAASAAMQYSTANQVKVLSYTGRLNKKDIVALGQRLQLPWELIWSCYRGEALMCGKCESCQRMIRAFHSLGLNLPQNFLMTE